MHRGGSCGLCCSDSCGICGRKGRPFERLLICLAQTHHWTGIDPLSHPVEVDKKAEEHLIGCGAVFVNPAKIAEDGYAGHVLAVESEDTRGLLTEPRCPFGGRYLAVQMVVLAIVCGGDLCQQAGDHFDDVGHGHLADLVLRAHVCRIASLPAGERPRLGEGTRIVDGKALDV